MNFLKYFIQNLPNDSGPIYQETIMGRFPVEPFNTFSNFLFLILIFYFFNKIRGKYKQHLFLTFCLPIIFISWIGGTIYHGTRSHEFWLFLDWLPIMFLCLCAIIYLVFKVTESWVYRISILLFLICCAVLPRFLTIDRVYKISFGYVLTAFAVIVPFLLYGYKTKWKNFSLVLSGLLFFGVAISLRTLDNLAVLLPMGTHWLWHSFGAVSVFMLLLYLYKDKELA